MPVVVQQSLRGQRAQRLRRRRQRLGLEQEARQRLQAAAAVVAWPQIAVAWAIVVWPLLLRPVRLLVVVAAPAAAQLLQLRRSKQGIIFWPATTTSPGAKNRTVVGLA